MEQSDQSKAALISGIESDAAQEVASLLAEAEKQAAEKRKYGTKKAEALLAEARQRGQEQADAITRKVVSNVELEVKRLSLRTRDALMKDIMVRVEEKLKAMVDTPGYRVVLRDWIMEAVRGLALDEAQLNASAPERKLMDEALLKEVTSVVTTASGKPVVLTLADEVPLEEQGVLVTATSGRMAFNNQVKTRLLRNRRQIHMLIHKALFADKQEESL